LLEFEESMFLKVYFPPDGFGAFEENMFMPKLYANVYFDIRTIGDADTIVDLGAHSGSFTIYSLLYSKPRAKIIAIEPDKDNYRLLLNNLKIFENIINEKKLRVLALRKAIWAKRGILKFIKTKWSEGGYVTGTECNNEASCVDAITLDDIINISSGKTIVKVDIEGAEIPVLAASSKLSKVSELAIEAHGNARYLIRLLKLKGYNPEITVYRLTPHLARQWLKIRPRAYGFIIATYRLLVSSTYKPTITIVKASRSQAKP
jgi:FkbM family methyltransferase